MVLTVGEGEIKSQHKILTENCPGEEMEVKHYSRSTTQGFPSLGSAAVSGFAE